MALLQEAGHGMWETDDGPSERSIDPEIIGTMAALGLDCHKLHQSLLTEEFTDLTALYRILRREKLMELNRNLLTKVPTLAMGLKPQLKPIFKPRGPVEAATESPRAFPMLGRAAIMVPTVGGTPIPGVAGAPRRLSTPVGGGAVGARRLSRPVAVRRPVAGVTALSGAPSHETP
jgi:hypothetical protein